MAVYASAADVVAAPARCLSGRHGHNKVGQIVNNK